MNPIDDELDLSTETTEQALARFEAECGWSDAGRFADAFASTPAEPSDAGGLGAA